MRQEQGDCRVQNLAFRPQRNGQREQGNSRSPRAKGQTMCSPLHRPTCPVSLLRHWSGLMRLHLKICGQAGFRESTSRTLFLASVPIVRKISAPICYAKTTRACPNVSDAACVRTCSPLSQIRRITEEEICNRIDEGILATTSKLKSSGICVTLVQGTRTTLA